MSETHYKLHRFVCFPSCLRAPDFEGWATFSAIFRARPAGCRYAVAEHPPGAFLVWDLFDDTLLQSSPEAALVPPPPIYAGTNLDALLMKTVALYGEE